MIHITNSRVNGGPPFVTEFDRSIPGAFTSLVKFELGYGGQIMILEPTKIVVRTRIFDCVDTVTFAGTEEDMAPLVRAAILHCTIQTQYRKELVESAAEATIGVTGGLPELVRLIGPHLLGMGTTKLTLMAFLKLDEAQVKANREASVDDLCAVAELFITEGPAALTMLGPPN